MKRIGLGTAQLGSKYGINNKIGVPSRTETEKILNICIDSEIDTIDTAMSYGNSEDNLGLHNLQHFKVVTKLKALPKDHKNIESWVKSSVENSMKRLNISKIYGLLLHDSSILQNQKGKLIYQSLLELKNEKLIGKLGISIYSPQELDRTFNYYPFDLIQAPFNVFDRRIEKSGWLDKLKRADIEIHVRSIFLQGILLMKEERPDYFKPWDKLFGIWDRWNEQNNIKKIHSCLAFVLSNKHIDRVIIGVESSNQLKEILSYRHSKTLNYPDEISSDDIQLVDPSKWSIK